MNTLKRIHPAVWVAVTAGALLLLAAGYIIGVNLQPRTAPVLYQTGAGYNPDGSSLVRTVDGTPGPAPAISQQDLNVLNAFQNASRAVAQAVLPVVVRIDVAKVARNPATGGQGFRFFFNGQPFNGPSPLNPDQGNQDQGQDQSNQTPQTAGFGSGIIFDQKGDTVYVLTNNHVVDGADKVTIQTWDNRTFEGKVLGTDTNRDLAVVSFASKDAFRVARFGNSDAVRPGDLVYAVGSPYGIANTITQGIVSGTGRTGNDLPDSGNGIKGFTDYLQTDAAINPGNSGGALVNLQGEVIGVNTWIATRTGENVGLGFAVPINNARKAATDLATKGKTELAWLGIYVVDVPDDYRESMKLTGQSGGLVMGVISGSPAAGLGIQPGDLITAVNGQTTKTSNDVIRTVAGLDAGTEYAVKLVRSGKATDFKIKLGIRPADGQIGSSFPGFNVVPITPQIKQQLANQRRPQGQAAPVLPDSGLVVAGFPDAQTNAKEAGVQQGDVITSVNGKNVATPAEFFAALGTSGDLQLKLQRNGKDISLSFPR